MSEIIGVDASVSLQSTGGLAGLLGAIEQAFEPVREVLVPILSDPLVVGVWAVTVFASVGVLWWDLRTSNRILGSMMKATVSRKE